MRVALTSNRRVGFLLVTWELGDTMGASAETLEALREQLADATAKESSSVDLNLGGETGAFEIVAWQMRAMAFAVKEVLVHISNWQGNSDTAAASVRAACCKFLCICYYIYIILYII